MVFSVAAEKEEGHVCQRTSLSQPCRKTLFTASSLLISSCNAGASGDQHWNW